MKKVFLLIFFVVCTFASWGKENDCQDSIPGYEYDEIHHIYWLTEDSVYFAEDAPIKASDIPIYVTLTSYGAGIIVYNQSDEVIYVKWNDIAIKGDEQYMGSSLVILVPDRRINYTTKGQPQYIAKGDNSFANLDSQYGYYIIDEKNLKKLYKKTKQKIPLRYEIKIPIICNDERFNYIIVRKGLYKGK